MNFIHIVFFILVLFNSLFLYLSYNFSTWFLILLLILIPILSLVGYGIKDHFNFKDKKKSKKQIESQGRSGVEQGGGFIIECFIVSFISFLLCLISYFTFEIIIQDISIGFTLFIIQIILIIVWVYKDYK